MYNFTEGIFFALIIFFGVYILQNLVLIAGLFFGDRSYIVKNNEPVSIIVAARNEEKNISECIESLLKIDYPKELLEIIIVDDNSIDKTAEIVRSYQSKNSHLKLITCKGSSQNLKGKANALHQGILKASSDIIMLTDADCVVQKSWVKSTVKYFDKNVGVIAGYTLLKINNWFHAVQSLDWTYILNLSASTINLKDPLSCIGNNYCFRKNAYLEVGGYEKIKFSVTEDFALFTAIVNSGHWQYRFPADPNRLVLTKPLETFRELYQQKRRWSVGGLDMKLSGLILMSNSYIFHLFLAACLILNLHLVETMYIFLFKAILDFIYVAIGSSICNYKSQLKYFLQFQIYFVFSLFITPFAALFGGKVIWKERTF